VENFPYGTRRQAGPRATTGRMSFPAAIRCIGTSQSASPRHRRGP
jgi:hypothetical protein